MEPLRKERGEEALERQASPGPQPPRNSQLGVAIADRIGAVEARRLEARGPSMSAATGSWLVEARRQEARGPTRGRTAIEGSDGL